MKSTKDSASAYAKSGVDLDAADTAKTLIKKKARSTFNKQVLTDIGLFGAFYELKDIKNPVLVSSTDGVGTKLKIAALMNKHDTVGIDLVNHCVNDILCCGATPLFFLDYIAMGKLIPKKVEKIISGLVKACQDTGCALIGGETAEMPGLYQEDDYDLAGFIVGVVTKEDIINGNKIAEGDIILGLPSSGLHTNGYSLVRKIFNIDNNPDMLNKYYPELKSTLGEELLKPHLCYLKQISPLLKKIKGLVHITGGGFEGNIPRILPQGMCAEINKKSWCVPAIFELIKKQGNISEKEMYRVFNMGIGMAIVCDQKSAKEIAGELSQAVPIGRIIKSTNSKIII